VTRYSTPKRIRIRGKPTECFYVRRYDTVTRDRVWVSTGKTNLRAALEQVRSWELADATGKGPAQDIHFAQAVDRWLEVKQSKMTDRGHATYRAYAQHWVDFLPAKATVRAITKARVEDYFRARGVAVTNATLNKERSQMRQFFRWAIKHGWCDEDPSTTVDRFAQERREIRALTAEEEAALLAACHGVYKKKVLGLRNSGGPQGGQTTGKKSAWEQECKPPPAWLHPLVFLALHTGLRYGTLESLEWGWVDWREKMIRIPPEHMKAREGLSIPLDHETALLLVELKKDATSLRVLDIPERGNVRKTFQRAVERSGIPPVRFHDLRATYITQCRNAGVDLEVTARLVGHRDVKTTLRFYRRISDAELKSAVEKLQAKKAKPAALPPREGFPEAGG